PHPAFCALHRHLTTLHGRVHLYVKSTRSRAKSTHQPARLTHRPTTAFHAMPRSPTTISEPGEHVELESSPTSMAWARRRASTDLGRCYVDSAAVQVRCAH